MNRVVLDRQGGHNHVIVYLDDPASIPASVIDDVKAIVSEWSGPADVTLVVQRSAHHRNVIQLGRGYRVEPCTQVQQLLERVGSPR